MVLKIREYREEAKLTQAELAAKIQNVQRNISNWENGTSEPDCQSILAIANAFKIPIDQLFGRNLIKDNSVNEIDRELNTRISALTNTQKKNLLLFLDSVLK